MTIALLIAAAALAAALWYAKAQRDKRIAAEAEAAKAAHLAASLRDQAAESARILREATAASAAEINRREATARKEEAINEQRIANRDAIAGRDPSGALAGSLDVLHDLSAKRSRDR
jgi:uncharacterized protein HemX